MSLRAATFVAAVLAATAGAGAGAQEARRHVDAHVHGAGTLAIAIDATSVEMELQAPASDIIGFEHAPSNATQRKAVADAKAKLAKGLDLFQPPPEAGCELAAAQIDVIGDLAGKGGKAHSHDHKGHGHGKEKGSAKDKPESAHSEFKAVYRLTCKSPDRLATIAFPYFKAFPKAEKLTVTAVGPKGQSSGTATRSLPSVPLTGAI